MSWELAVAATTTKVTSKTGRRALSAWLSEKRDWHTWEEINNNLQSMEEMIDKVKEEQARELNDVLAKWLALVKTYRFDIRQEQKLKFLRSTMNNKLVNWGMAEEDDYGNIVPIEGPKGGQCRRVRGLLAKADGKQAHIQTRWGTVNRFADKDIKERKFFGRK